MLPSCRHVAEQLSENIDKPVTGIRWLRLKIHLWICEGCRRYGDQMELTSNTINMLSSQKKPSEELKSKLIQQYRQHSSGSNKESASK